MSDRVTFDDVYEIAAEVAEETVKKFLTNLVKLVPQAADVVDEIRDEQYEELRSLRQGKLQENRRQPVPQRRPVRQQEAIIPVDDNDDAFYDDAEDEFAAIAHPATSAQTDPDLDVDTALSQITLEKSDLFGEAAHSEVIDNAVVPMGNLEGNLDM